MKRALTAFLFLPLLFIPATVFSQNSTKEMREEIKNEIKNKIQQRQEKSVIARLTKASVTAKSDQSFTVTVAGKNYTVSVVSTTRFRRHFWGESRFFELAVNNMVNVWGRFTDDAKTTIEAKLVRNLTVQKRRGVFFGTITSKGSDTFVLDSRGRGSQTVTVSSVTKYINRRGGVIAFSDLAFGDKVRLRGVWDKSNSTISEVNEAKDFNIPKITPSPVSNAVEATP